MRILRAILLTISVTGFLAFGGAFVISLVRPLLIESLAKEFVRREVEVRVQERIAVLDGTILGKFAQRMLDRNERAALSKDLSQKVAAVVAQMEDADCECRKFIAHGANVLLTLERFTRATVKERLTQFIQTKYSEVVRALMREFRIFTAANALIFLLLGATTYCRRAAGLQLLLPAVVLVGSATLVGTLYLFGQDWLHTILFSDYVGFGYFAYVGFAVVCLADIVFNRARVTTEVVNAGFNLAGAAIQAVPC